MEFYNYEEKSPLPSHFEYTLGVNKEAFNPDLKDQALQSLKGLHGWCSEYKASVLFDLITILKPEVIVEIGVFGGKSLIPMAYALKNNQGGIIYGIDPWDSEESIQGMEGANREWWQSVNHQTILDHLKGKIKHFNLDKQIILIKKTSADAKVIHNIDILHIDGNHSEEAAYLDVNKWTPYVKKGGLIIFDDVGGFETDKAVEWLNENCILLTEFSGENVWGIWVKP